MYIILRTPSCIYMYRWQLEDVLKADSIGSAHFKKEIPVTFDQNCLHLTFKQYLSIAFVHCIHEKLPINVVICSF